MSASGQSKSPTVDPASDAPSCPRCGGRLTRIISHRVSPQRITCASCGFAWDSERAARGLFQPRQIFSESCEYCHEAMLPSARFCVACGRAQPGVNEILQSTARRTQLPLETLEEQAWHEDNSLSALWKNVFWLETKDSELAARLARLEAAGVTVTVPAPEQAPATAEAAPAVPATPGPIQELPPEVRVPAIVPAPKAIIPEPEIETIPRQRESVLPRAAATVSTEPAFAPLFIGSPPDATPRAPKPAVKRREVDIEQLVSGRGMALAGGLAVLLGAIFFLSLAFSRGWIGPELRVGMGVAAASAMVLLGGRFFGRNEAIVGHVLTAVGLGVMSLSMFAGTRLYDLFPVELGLVGSMIAAAAAAFIAIRNNLQIVAGYGLVAALAAPPLLGASVNGVTIALLATTLIGTTAIALSRSWHWLPPAAFLLAAPQIGDWLIDRPAIAPGMATLAGFWTLNALSAGGEAFRQRNTRLQPTSATLLLANAAFLVWGGYMVLDTSFDTWGGTFLLAVALAHAALGGWFLRDRGAWHPFGMLALGTGVAALTMAIPIQFGGPIVPIAYAAEAAALAWVAGRLRHLYAGQTAIVLGAFSIAHVLLFEYPVADLMDAHSPDRLFLNGAAMTVGFQLLALAAAGYFVRIATVRQSLAAIGLMLTAYALPFELSDVWLIAAWSALTAVGFLLLGASAWQRGDGLAWLPGRLWLTAAACGAWLLAVGHLFTYEYPFDQLSVDAEQSPPFVNANGLALLILLAGIAVAGSVRAGIYRLPAAIAGFGLVLWAMPFELSGIELVAGWSAVSLLAIAASRVSGFSTIPDTWGLTAKERETFGNAGMMVPALAGWLLALAHVLAVELSNATVGGGEGTPFTDDLAIGAGMLILVAMAGARLTREHPWSTGWSLGAIAVAALVIPFQVGAASNVAGWSLLAAIAMLIAERRADHSRAFLATTAFLLVAAAWLAFGDVAPIDRLFVDAGSQINHPLLWSGATVAFGALAAVLALFAWRRPELHYRPWIWMAAGAMIVYLLSVGIVDHFQQQVGDVDLESLQKRAQVGLSILWAALGGLTFALGVLRRHREARLMGLGLLGIATAKVFIYDLSSLDASYRVLSLIGLGLLLLASSYLYLRYIGPLDREEAGDEDSAEEIDDLEDHAPTSVVP